ncbi:MAG: phosphoribosyltransferase [bacterium]|nr:phosphoribosyltransferase [bacterium]
MFNDRKDAGKKLAKALEKYKNKNVVVLAIPRGGVEVGYEVAKYLNAELSVIVSRKLPSLENPESGFGAIAEDGSLFMFDFAKRIYSTEVINRIIEEQKSEIKRRIQLFRKGKALPEIKGKTVILVDDGIAMGSTIYASILLCRNKKAGEIIVAAPVSGMDTKEIIKEAADEVIILETPDSFHAVAESYLNWYDVPDEEVIKILNKFGN